MDGTPRAHTPADGIVLWQRGAMTCTCQTHSPDRIVIRLIVVGAIVQHQVFSDSDGASKFAIDKMHAYDGLPPRHSR